MPSGACIDQCNHLAPGHVEGTIRHPLGCGVRPRARRGFDAMPSSCRSPRAKASRSHAFGLEKRVFSNMRSVRVGRAHTRAGLEMMSAAALSSPARRDMLVKRKGSDMSRTVDGPQHQGHACGKFDAVANTDSKRQVRRQACVGEEPAQGIQTKDGKKIQCARMFRRSRVIGRPATGARASACQKN